jgi:hypothetical protein
LFGVLKQATTKRLRWPPGNTIYATTNQKHAIAIEMDRRGRANGKEQGGSAIPSFWGQSSRAGIKNEIKLMSLLINLFLGQFTK